MPGLQTIVSELNNAFSRHNINKLVPHRDLFAPNKPLGSAGIIVQKGSENYKLWQQYLGNIPPSIRKTIQQVIYHALDPKSPTPINWAWAPGYDYEVTLWDVPDNAVTNTPGGITILIKSSYPKEGSKKPSRRMSK